MLVALLLVVAAPAQALAGEADVEDVKITCAASVCELAVTVRHADEGWDHYANRWEVLGPDGTVLATRILRHPHVKEQPFTRALPGVRIPAGVTAVTIRAHDSVHAHGGAEVTVEVPR